MKRILKSKLDKFYTKTNVAKNLIKHIDISKFDLIIDPSCGSGAFYTNIKHENKIAIDIEPELSDAIKRDFLLEWNYTNTLNNNILTITNPPFGKQGSLALKFIKKSALFSNTIAMILPLSFVKDSMKNKIPEYFHLKYEEILLEDSFLLDNKDYNVKCVFQIWEKSSIKREKIKTIKPNNFKYTKNKNDADLSIRRVGVYAGKGFIDTNKSEQSHYFIILEDKRFIHDIIFKLDNKKWIDYTVGPRSISKSELNQFLNSII